MCANHCWVTGMHEESERTERALSDARPCAAGSAELLTERLRLTERELFGNPCYFDSDPVTSKQLAESFPTVPDSPSNSQGKPRYSFLASASPPLTVERAYMYWLEAYFYLYPSVLRR